MVTSCLMLTTVMLLWSLGIIVAKSVSDLVNPIGFSFWRWMVAAGVLTPFVFSQFVSQRRVILQKWPYYFLLGLFMAGGSTMLMWSVQYTSATNVALFSASQPMVTALMTWVILKDAPTRLQLSGMVAALVGIAVMATRMDIRVLLDLTFNLGDLFVLVAVLFYSLYSVNLHRWFADVSPFLMMYLTVLGGIIILIPFYGYELQSLGGFYPSIEVCVAIVFMATIPTIVATTMWNVSVGAVGANRASIFLSLLPIFGIGLAVSFLGEALLNYHFVGAFLICAGIAAVVWPQEGL